MTDMEMRKCFELLYEKLEKIEKLLENPGEATKKMIDAVPEPPKGLDCPPDIHPFDQTDFPGSMKL